MAFKDYSNDIANVRKKKKEEDNKTSVSSQGIKDYSSDLDRHFLTKSIGFDTLESDVTSLSKTIGNVYNGWQTRETMENTRSSVQSIYDRLSKYQEYQKKYGGTDLSELQSAYKSVLDDWDDLSKNYGKYKNADAYNNAVKVAKKTAEEYEGMKVADLGVVQTEVSELEKIFNIAKKYDDKATDYSKQSMNLRNPSAIDGFSKNLKKLTDERDAYLKSVGYESMDALKKALGEKKVYLNKAQRVQDSISLSSVADVNSENYDKDFNKYAEKGKALGKEKNDWWNGGGTYKNQIAYMRENPDYLEMYEDAADNNGKTIESLTLNQLTYVAAKYMTDDEAKIYNYYVGKDDEEGAEKYLKSIEEALKQRQGSAIYDEREGMLSKYTFGYTAGIDQFTQGIINVANTKDDYIPTTGIQNASALVREDIAYEHGTLGQVGYDLINTTSNMLPSILTSTVVSAVATPVAGQIVGAGLMGTSAAGGAYQEMLNLGYDKGQARTYSTLVGLSEAGLQYALGGISKLGGVGGKVSKAVSGIDNGLAKFAIRWGGSALSEGFEEAAQEVLTPLFTNIAAGYDTGADIDWSEVVYSGLLGALSGGVLEGGGLAVNSYAEHSFNKGMGQTIKANERVGDVFDIASNPEVASAYDVYTRYAKKGINADNVSDAQLGRLYSTARADAVETLESKKTTAEQKTGAMQTLAKLSAVETENTVKKEAKKFNVGEETKVTDSGETVDVKDLKVKGDEVKVVTEKGEISVDDITLTQNDAELVAFAKEISKADGEDVANLFISQYDGKTNIDEYANSFNLTMAYAKNNFRYDTILNKKGVLSTDAVNKIYQETRIKADKERAEYIKKLNEKMADKKFYKGFIDEAVIDYENTSAEGKVNWNDLDAKQKQAVTFIKGFAKATGMNLVLEHNPDGKYNGKFEVKSNTITIDISNPGKVFQLRETIIPTMSHETTHWMKDKSPELYRHLNEIVFSTLAEHYNSNTEQAIKDKIELLKWADPGKAYTEETVKERNITEEEIIRAEVQRKGKTLDESRDEIIARACEDMLAMSERGKRIFTSLSENDRKTLVEKIKGIVNDLLNWVNELLSSYESTSTEARIMREYKEELQKASKVWDEMLGKSIKANQSLEKSGAYGHINSELANVGLQIDSESNSVAPTTLFSERTWTESEYVQDRETAINAIVKALGVTKAEAERYVDNINGIARMIADDRTRLDYEKNIDEHASALKTNKEYKWTVDMSTLCAKRLLFTGTFDAIQKKLPNTIFNSEDIVALRSMMMERGYEVACGICYVESTRRELGPITAEFIERYKLAQKNGTPISKINSAGKEVILQEKGTKRNFYAEEGYIPTLAELNTTDIDLVKRDHPEVYAAYLSFMKSRGQAIPKLLETRTEYKGEILKHFNSKSAVQSRNDAGGLRVQSFSDFEVAHLIDMMQIVLDMSRVGLMSQAYTKVPAFADVFGKTGIKINLSLIAKDSGLDANGNLIFDDVEGMPHKEAFRLRDKYSKNVGTILVGKNDAHIRAALADTRIDFVIPFHKSFWKESLYDALGLTGYDDYTETQNEKPFDKERKIKNFQPSEYWDYSKSGEENAKTYLKMCAEDGRIPKFPQFQNCEGYWKLLIDFKMYDNDGVGSPQMTVKPDFSMDEANAILDNYEGGHREFPVAQDVVDDFVKQNEGRNDILYSERDADYMEVVESGDMETAQRMVYEAAKEAGYTIDAYHGTPNNDFTVFDKNRVGKGTDQYGAGFYFASNKTVAQSYGERVINSRLAIKNPLRINRQSTKNVANLIDAGYDHLLTEEQAYEVIKRLPNIYDAEESPLGDYYDSYWENGAEDWMIQDLAANESYRNIGYLDSDLFRNYPNELHEALRDVVGYDGVEVTLPIGDKFYVAWFDNQMKSADPVAYDDNGNVIPLSQRFNNENNDIRYSDRDYSYETLVAKPDMKLTVLDANVPNNRADIIHQAKKNAAKIGNVNAKDKNVSVYVDDIGKDVVLGTKGLQHGLRRGKTLQTDANSFATLKAGEIIKNSIRINELTPENQNADSSYVLIGAANGNNGDLHIVESVINQFSNELMSMDVLYSVNAKKENRLRSMRPEIQPSVTDSTISIAELLDYVNKYFPDILPESVLRHYGYDARPEGELGESALYSDREDTSVYDIMGETDRILKENENFKAEIERLNERLKIERKVTKGSILNDNQLLSAAGHLRNISNSTIDKVELARSLKDVYSFIANSENLTWEEVFEKCHTIAESMLEKSKPEVMVDDYYKQILKDIRNTRISLSESQKKEAQNIFDKNWNRYFFGSVIITDKGIGIESKWQEWASQYPGVFDADISEGDMIVELYNIINTLRESSEVVVEYDMEERTRWLANEIYNQYWNVSPIRTTADKYDKQIKRLNAEHRRTMAELRDDYKSRLNEQHKADKEKYTKLAKKIRERRDEQIALAKQHGRERLDKYKENAERKTVIQRITANSSTLNKWLTKNSKDYHIHEAMKGPVVKLLQSIDFSSKKMLEKGDPTQRDISFAEAFAEVRAMLQDADNMVEGLEALYGHDLAEDIKRLAERTYSLVGDNNFIINAMTLEELQSLDKLVRHIKKVVTELNQFHTIHHNQGAVNLANEFMEHGEKLGNIKKQHGKMGKFFEFRNRTPYYFFKDLGNVGRKLFEAFQDGWDKLAFNAKRVIDFANETYTEKEVKEWSKETK